MVGNQEGAGVGICVGLKMRSAFLRAAALVMRSSLRKMDGLIVGCAVGFSVGEPTG